MFRQKLLTMAALLMAAPLSAAPLDDPMRPPGAPLISPSAGHAQGAGATAYSGYTLSSTIIDGERRLAVINGRRYAEGDRLGSARIERILLTQVVLRFPSGARTLHLLPGRTPPIKRPSEQ